MPISNKHLKVQLFTTVLLISTYFAFGRNTLFSFDEPIAQLKTSNFSSVIHGSPTIWIVEFYAAWCGYCQRMAPEYSALARDIQGWSDIVGVAAVACSDVSNAILCRTYGVNGYPTVKMFPPNSDDTFHGHRYEGEKNADGLRVAVLEYLVEVVKQGGSDQSWPKLSHIKHPRELWQKKGTKDVYVVVEDDTLVAGNVGLMAILDSLQLRPDVAVGRMTIQSAQLYGISTAGLYRSTNFGGLLEVTRETNRRRLEEAIRTSSGHGNTDLNARLMTTVQPLRPSTMNILNYVPQRGLHTQDLESSLYYSLWVEIPSQTQFDGASLAALKSYVNLLRKYHPGEQHVKLFLKRVHQWLSNQRGPVSAEAWLRNLENTQSKDAYIEESLRWTGCNGSQPHLRGYPCSLWMTFHALTVNAYLKEGNSSSFNALDILIPIRDYVQYFLSCRECANNFGRRARTLEQSVQVPQDAVLWLWKSHNRANYHLHGDVTEDPRYPKFQFPSTEACPECRQPGTAAMSRFNFSENAWRQDKVLDYLLRYYGEDRIIDDDREGQTAEGSVSPVEEPSSCVATFTDWTPCSRTCDVGISTRMSNVNPDCQLKPELRMCLVRPCSAQFPDWTHSPWHVSNCPKLGHTYRLARQQPMTYMNCTTVASEAWRVCGKCPAANGRPICCRPARSSTQWKEVKCTVRNSQGKARALVGSFQVEIVDYCQCDEHCFG